MQQTFPTLVKRTATGAVQEWDIVVDDNGDSTATITVTQGQQGGAKQVYQDVVKEGKNVGRSNETTPWEQAVAEAASEWAKKKDRKHYGLTLEESVSKKADAPMLAKVFEQHAKRVDWKNAFAQPKFDGHRCLAICDATGVSLWSRTGKQIDTTPHIVDALQSVMLPGDRFDGEMYLHGTPLAEISSYVKRQQEGSGRLTYHIYDAVLQVPFMQRYDLVQERCLSYDPGAISMVETIRVEDETHLMRFQSQCLEAGYEGSMLRHGVSGYEPGKRSASLLKCRTFTDAEFQIVGVTEGRGTYAGMAIFTCVTPQGHRFEVTAPGSHEEKRAAWIAREQNIGRLLTVKFQNWTVTEQPVPFLPIAKNFV